MEPPPPRSPLKVPMSTGEKVKQQLERLGITVRASPRAWTIGIAFVALWAGTAHGPGKMDPIPSPTPRSPPGWTADVITPSPAWLLGSLPPLDERQRRPPCRSNFNEEAINGGCWFRLDAKPPCPVEPDLPSFEHAGKCYMYALRAEKAPREPRSGDFTAPNAVANPP